jgi:hypothetical protein
MIPSFLKQIKKIFLKDAKGFKKASGYPRLAFG